MGRLSIWSRAILGRGSVLLWMISWMRCRRIGGSIVLKAVSGAYLGPLDTGGDATGCARGTVFSSGRINDWAVARIGYGFFVDAFGRAGCTVLGIIGER